MNNHQHLVEVVVGRILDKYNVSPSQDLSFNDKSKVKNTVIDIQEEVDKFLKHQGMDTPEKPIKKPVETGQFKTDFLGSNLTKALPVKEKEVETDVVEPTNYVNKPATARIKYSPNAFINRRRRF